MLARGTAVVAFDLTLASTERTLLVSGPNTGGKTVLLKAIGLLCAMAQMDMLTDWNTMAPKYSLEEAKARCREQGGPQLTGAARYLFTPLSMAVVFAMLASYLLSRTLVPTMVHFLLKPEVEIYAQGEENYQGGGIIWRAHHAFDGGNNVSCKTYWSNSSETNGGECLCAEEKTFPVIAQSGGMLHAG